MGYIVIFKRLAEIPNVALLVRPMVPIPLFLVFTNLNSKKHLKWILTNKDLDHFYFYWKTSILNKKLEALKKWINDEFILNLVSTLIIYA